MTLGLGGVLGNVLAGYIRDITGSLALVYNSGAITRYIHGVYIALKPKDALCKQCVF
ncbi:MAG: hypothetical protein HRU24_07365 [Gammaproteobacteria bacterium]|nr:hypothetical protein [Gammaproteobacteria bacterium]